MGHLLYLIFRCDFDVMESLKNLEELGQLNTAPVSFDCCVVPIASITVDNSKKFYLSITIDIFVYIVNSGYFCVREMH